MPRKSSPPPRPATWSAEQTLRALTKQLQELGKLKGREYDEAEHEEQKWQQSTELILTNGFGGGSPNLTHFYNARSAGDHYISFGPISRDVFQNNYNQRIAAYEAALGSSIEELKFSLPEHEIKGVYEPGDEYALYRDLKSILGLAAERIRIFDNYLDTQIFDIYMDHVPNSVTVEVCTDQLKPTVAAVAEKFALRQRFQLRSSSAVHDRVLFVDDRCWVIGQSIKDAARRKPTYIVELPDLAVGAMHSVYDQIWETGQLVVSS